MTDKKKRFRQTIDLTDFVEDINKFAKKERRSRAQMVQKLISEAIEFRKSKE